MGGGATLRNRLKKRFTEVRWIGLEKICSRNVKSEGCVLWGGVTPASLDSKGPGKKIHIWGLGRTKEQGRKKIVGALLEVLITRIRPDMIWKKKGETPD